MLGFDFTLPLVQPRLLCLHLSLCVSLVKVCSTVPQASRNEKYCLDTSIDTLVWILRLPHLFLMTAASTEYCILSIFYLPNSLSPLHLPSEFQRRKWLRLDGYKSLLSEVTIVKNG